jgi:Spy/CpxP family protein refolding chaperone
MASTLKIVFAVGGIFVAGAVTGGFAGWRASEYMARDKRTKPIFGPNEIGGRLAEQLQLTDAQKKEIRPILARTSEELRTVRRDSFNQTAAIINRLDADMAKVLTAEQQVLLKDLRGKEEERRKKWMEDRAKRNDQRPSGAPAEGGAPSRSPGDMPPLPPARTP